jgi:coenzyme F420-reducing hydrogenase alpha subunit
LGIREDHIFKWFANKQIVEFTGAKAIHQRAVIGGADKRPPADRRKILLAADLHGSGETLQACMAFVLNR